MNENSIPYFLVLVIDDDEVDHDPGANENMTIITMTICNRPMQELCSRPMLKLCTVCTVKYRPNVMEI